MVSLLFIALSIFASVNATPLLELNQEWNRFLEEFRPEYKNPIEYEYRRKIFEENLESIQTHNIEYDLGLHTYRKGINQFTDKTDEEKRQGFLGFKIPEIRYHTNENENTVPFADSKDIPDSIDWRDRGAVTPVKNQRQCGSCWAFSTTGTLEGQYFLATNKSVSFSEQQLVDCSKKNYGCRGGDMETAYEDLQKMGGIATEASYPYRAKDRKCKFNKATAIAEVAGYHTIQENDEDALKQAVALHGPVAVAIEATGEFQEYENGIFYNEDCSNDPESLNHGVLVVGYGSENGTDYWIVKNSWGKRWGEKGYIKMSRNRKNNCQIAAYASYPVVKPRKQ